MSLEYFVPLFERIEKELTSVSSDEVFSLLQKLSIDAFALSVWRKSQMTDFPNLDCYLAPLPHEDIQARFAGGRGEALLPRAVHFGNYLKQQLLRQYGRTNVKIIDYGCGWGRISRLLPYFTSYSNMTLLDPNPDCYGYLEDSKLQERFQTIPRVPATSSKAPEFDVCILFSILTHTPEHVTRAIFEHLSGTKDRLVIVTVRPETFWKHSSSFATDVDGEACLEEHRKTGYAFVPQAHNILDYGEASYSLERMTALAADYGMDLFDCSFSLVDPLQIYFTFKTR